MTSTIVERRQIFKQTLQNTYVYAFDLQIHVVQKVVIEFYNVAGTEENHDFLFGPVFS